MIDNLVHAADRVVKEMYVAQRRFIFAIKLLLTVDFLIEGNLSYCAFKLSDKLTMPILYIALDKKYRADVNMSSLDDIKSCCKSQHSNK